MKMGGLVAPGGCLPVSRCGHESTPYPVRFWRYLWQNKIRTLEKLRSLHTSTGIVVIKINRTRDSGPLELRRTSIIQVGVAYLPPTSDKSRPSIPSPASLRDIIQRFNIESSTFRVSGKERNEKKCEDAVPFGTSQTVPLDRIQDTVYDTIKGFTGKDQPKPILAGFEMQPELRIIVVSLPRLFSECFSAWVDIQDLAMDPDVDRVLRPGLDDARRGRERIALREFLGVMGYGENGNNKLCHLQVRQPTGNNAVKVLAAALGLLALVPAFENTGNIPIVKLSRRYETTDIGHGLRAKKYWPADSPLDLFPFTAKIQPLVRLPHNYFIRYAVYDAFSRYEPIAAGGGQAKKSRDKNGVRCLYLSFATEGAVQRFIAEVDGRTHFDIKGDERDKDVVWRVTRLLPNDLDTRKDWAFLRKRKGGARPRKFESSMAPEDVMEDLACDIEGF